MEHVSLRGNVYHYRRKIPADLIDAHKGRREVTRSLKTKDRRTAAVEARRVSVRLDAEWDALRGTGGDPAPVPKVEAPAPVAPKPRPLPVGQTVDKLIPHWERERKPAVKSVHLCRTAAEEFNALTGSPAVAAITRAMLVDFRDHLLAEGRAVNTVNTKLTWVRALLDVAVDRGMVSVNVAAGTSLREDKRAPKSRIPYTPEQAARVLADTEQYREAEPVKFWVPRLLYWTGMRINEAVQLRRQDVQARDGHPGVLVTDEGEHGDGVAMRAKTAGSVRWVPLHPAMLAFVQWANAQPDGPLFKVKANKFGVVSDALSKWMGRQLRTRWGVEDRRVVAAHGFRHLMADRLRVSGAAPEVRFAILGHVEGGTAGGYGSGELPPKLLAEAVARLE